MPVSSALLVTFQALRLSASSTNSRSIFSTELSRAAFLTRLSSSPVRGTSMSSASSSMEPIRAFHAVSAGLQLALAELYKLDMRALDLTAAMDLLLNGAESIPADWIGTGHSFEPARTGDQHDERALRRISGALARDPALNARTPGRQGDGTEEK